MADATISRADDYLDVFVAPSKLFERRADGKFGQALLVLLLATAVLFVVTRSAVAPIWDAEIERGMSAAQSGSAMTPEQLETGRKFAGIIGAASLIIGLPVGVFLLGACIWLAARVIGKSLGYAQGATIAAFAMFPRLVESAVSAVQALMMEDSSLNSRFAVSLGIGLKVMARASTSQALAASILVWCLGAIPTLLGSLTR